MHPSLHSPVIDIVEVNSTMEKETLNAGNVSYADGSHEILQKGK